jgi:hypothetical protein
MCYPNQRIIVEIEQVVLHSLTLISFDAIIAASHKIWAKIMFGIVYYLTIGKKAFCPMGLIILDEMIYLLPHKVN